MRCAQFSPLLMMATLLMSGCAGAPPIVEPVAASPDPEEEEVFFAGHLAEGPGPYRVQGHALGLVAQQMVVAVTKIRTASETLPDGTTVEEASVRLVFTKAGKTRSLWVDKGEEKRVFGVLFKVEETGESYLKARQDWFPFVILVTP